MAGFCESSTLRLPQIVLGAFLCDCGPAGLWQNPCDLRHKKRVLLSLPFENSAKPDYRWPGATREDADRLSANHDHSWWPVQPGRNLFGFGSRGPEFQEEAHDCRGIDAHVNAERPRNKTIVDSDSSNRVHVDQTPRLLVMNFERGCNLFGFQHPARLPD
jgi:hypothetical protein